MDRVPPRRATAECQGTALAADDIVVEGGTLWHVSGARTWLVLEMLFTDHRVDMAVFGYRAKVTAQPRHDHRQSPEPCGGWYSLRER
jgi:hypothetical protein